MTELTYTLTDYGPLRKLQAFQRLEMDIKAELKKISLLKAFRL